MCFIAITLNKDRHNLPLINSIIEEKQLFNDDGTAILSQNTNDQRPLIHRALKHNQRKIEQATKKHLSIVHLRASTGGTISQDNTHLWQRQNWIFAHNGSIPKLANTKDTRADSLIFFLDLLDEEYITPDGTIDINLIDRYADMTSLWGRFLLLHPKTQSLYLFGKWHTIHHEHTTAILSAQVSPTLTTKHYGLPFDTPIKNMQQSTIDGVWHIDTKTINASHLAETTFDEYKTPSYASNRPLSLPYQNTKTSSQYHTVKTKADDYDETMDEYGYPSAWDY